MKGLELTIVEWAMVKALIMKQIVNLNSNIENLNKIGLPQMADTLQWEIIKFDSVITKLDTAQSVIDVEEIKKLS